MSNRTNQALLLNDIIESGEKIMRYTSNMSFEEFISNEIIIDAVIRNFEIIGEAANRLSTRYVIKNQRNRELIYRQYPQQSNSTNLLNNIRY